MRRGGVVAEASSEQFSEVEGGPRLLRDISWLFVAEIVQTCIGLVIIAVLVRELPAEAYGRWMAILAIFQFTSLVNFGFPTYISRTLPADPRLSNYLFRLIRRIQFLLTPIIFGICSIAALYSSSLGILQNPLLILIGVGFLSTVLIQVNRSTLISLGLSNIVVFITLADRLLSLCLILYSKFWLGGEEIFLLLSFISGPMAGLLISEIYVRNLINKPRHRGEEGASSKQVVVESSPYLLNLVGPGVFDSFNRLMIFVSLGAVPLAVFDVAYRVLTAGNSITRSLRKAMLPVFSKSSDDYVGNLLKASNLVAWILPMGLLAGHFAGLSIPFVFSSSYGESVQVFFVLLFAWAVMLVNSPWLITVQAKKPPRSFSVVAIFAMVAGLTSSITLVPRMGVLGAAIAVVIWQLSFVVPSVAICRREFVQSGKSVRFAIMLCFSGLFTTSIYVISGESALATPIFSLVIVLAWMGASGWSLGAIKKIDIRGSS